MSERSIRNRVVEGDGDPRHGKPSTYKNHHCRCPECRAANSELQVKYLNCHPEQREKARMRQVLRNRVIARNRAKPQSNRT